MSALAPVPQPRAGPTGRNTRPHYTLSHWGMYEVSRSDGGSPELRPHQEDPDPSPIGLYQLDADVQAMRVCRPAVRESWLRHGPGAAPELRGREPFIEVSWDKALDLVADELQRVRTDFGNNAIFGGSYGWSSAGRFHHAQSQLRRFLNKAGGFVRKEDSYSLAAADVVLPHIIGKMDDLMDRHTSWEVLAEHTQLFVAFGGIPIKNAQVNSGGVVKHLAAEGLARMRERGVRFINIGPVRDNVGCGDEGAEWIACRPNTDTAVMLAMAQVLLEEGLHNSDFLQKYCVGFDTFASYLMGTGKDGVVKTPEWAERISTVPAAKIRAIVRQMAASRTIVNISWALQRAAHGEQAFWSLVSLAAMLGQIGTPGGGFGLGYGAINVVGSGHRRIKGPTFSQGPNPVKEFIPVARIADMLLNPGRNFTYNGGTYAYPDIRLIYWTGGNPYHHHQDLNKLELAWRKPDSVIIHEQFWTATAKRADIVLPATTTLERDDIGTAARECAIVAMKKAMEPFGEARDDFEIFCELAKRLGCGAEFDEGLDQRGWLRRLYGESRERNREIGVELPEFDAFWEEGVFDLTPFDRPSIMMEEFISDPGLNPVDTPTGKIEIFSKTVASFALEDCPGHPCWLEPFEWLGGASAAQYPIHLLSDQPARRLHSQLDPSPHSVAGKVQGREQVYMNARDAASRGIRHGQIVELFNDRGRCLAAAHVSEDLMSGVARLNTGAWFDPDPITGIERHGNPNVLTSDRGCSSLSQGSIAQTCLVEIKAFEGAVPELAAFRLPELRSELGPPA